MTKHPLTLVDEEELRRQVLAAADQLAFRQAQAVWLVDVCHLDYTRAATALGLATPTLATRLHAARDVIRRRLTIPQMKEHRMNETTIHTYKVPGISCDHCVNTITDKVTPLDGVEDVDVDLEAKSVTVTGGISGKIARAIVAAGYEIG